MMSLKRWPHDGWEKHWFFRLERMNNTKVHGLDGAILPWQRTVKYVNYDSIFP